MRDVLEAVTADAQAAQDRAERNRAEFPEFVAIVDSLRAQGGEVRVNWLAKEGLTVGPAPADWAEIFDEVPEPVQAPAYRGTRRRA